MRPQGFTEKANRDMAVLQQTNGKAGGDDDGQEHSGDVPYSLIGSIEEPPHDDIDYDKKGEQQEYGQATEGDPPGKNEKPPFDLSPAHPQVPKVVLPLSTSLAELSQHSDKGIVSFHPVIGLPLLM